MAEIKRDVELQILRRYAGGSEIIAIAKDLSVQQETVVQTISELAAFQRGRARELVRQYEAAHHPAAHHSAAVPKPALAQPKPAPAAEPTVTPRTDGGRSPVESILARATAAGGRYAQRARRIREQIIALDTELAGRRKVAEQEKRIQELRRELEKANAELRRLKLGGSRPVQTRVAADARQAVKRRAIREWAAANNIPCPARGVIPERVMDAYRAAQAPTQKGGTAA